MTTLNTETRQQETWRWACTVFGTQVASDVLLRALRFMEEAAELTQAVGLSRDDVHRMVDVVYDRPAGAAAQEIGGVVTTLSVLCTAIGVDMDAAARDELARIWSPTLIERIRARQASKPAPTRRP